MANELGSTPRLDSNREHKPNRHEGERAPLVDWQREMAKSPTSERTNWTMKDPYPFVIMTPHGYINEHDAAKTAAQSSAETYEKAMTGDKAAQQEIRNTAKEVHDLPLEKQGWYREMLVDMSIYDRKAQDFYAKGFNDGPEALTFN